MQNGATQGTGTAADLSIIIYTLLYVQGPVCMSEMGPDVQLPEKRLNRHLFAIPTLLLLFFYYCQSATTTGLQPSLAADRPEVAIAGSSLCDFFLDEGGLLPEWDKDSKHSRESIQKGISKL